MEIASSLDGFTRNLYHHLVDLNPNKDLICSPLSIQTSCAMLRMGADKDSETARQLDEGMNFNSINVKELAERFHTVLDYYLQCRVLHMANKVYIMKRYQASQEFVKVLTQKFLSQPENIDFSLNEQAAETINSWVKAKTNNLIKNLVSPSILNDESRLVLVNAIHFKGEWSIKFDENKTKREDFFLDDKNKIQAPMMNSTHNYYFAELPDLEAKALSIPYIDTALFLLVVLPNSITGLKDLELKLRSTQLETITSLLTQQKVVVKLPKFKAEFEQELTPVFRGLGMERIFSDQAEFGKILQQGEPLKVSKIVHKAFIEVNEEGTEAAAATALVVKMIRSAPLEPKIQIFHANHPFYYTIYDANHGCLFVGNLHNPADQLNSTLCVC
ncbi:GH18180 [Drosophila grimshawi]|uniref:GH18180 n=2 Tax=Drosophila grimshawi TaxID=7222 RepID=B4JG46_DROGR|nr:GH18180 [Drosophila grimshawi]